MKIPDEIIQSTVWRWFNQWQVWQARLKDTNKKTLFCGICGFVSPSTKNIQKHFLSERGRYKHYTPACSATRSSSCSPTSSPTCKTSTVYKNAFHFEWGPRRQQTQLDKYIKGYACGWKDDPNKGDRSDNEHYEEVWGSAEPKSDPDDEVATEGNPDDCCSVVDLINSGLLHFIRLSNVTVAIFQGNFFMKLVVLFFRDKVK